jgi:arsenical pump membrane protein
LPSVISIAATYGLLYWTQRRTICTDTVATDVCEANLSGSAKLAGIGLIAVAFILIVTSAIGLDLGLPTFLAGVATTALILIVKREMPTETLKGVSWDVLPLVGGLFVVVEALNRTGPSQNLAQHLSASVQAAPAQTAALSGLFVGLVSNLVNNLPAGLVAGSALQAAHLSDTASGAVLIGVDLGPTCQ